MILESVISFLLTACSPSEGTAGYPVNVQWTPTYASLYARADTTLAQDGTDMNLDGIWTPAASPELAQAPRKGAVHFRWNKYRYEAGYLNNAQAAEHIRMLLEEIGYEHVDSVIVTSYASPEGVYEHNQMLSRKRAREFEKVVKKEVGLAVDGLNITVREGGEAWGLLRERVQGDETLSELGRKRILKLLDNTEIGWDTKKWRMENGWLGSTKKEGDLYRWLLVHHYRYLRSLAVDIYVSEVVVAFDDGAIDVVPEEPTVQPADTVAVAPADSTVVVFEEEPVLTDEVPEAGVEIPQRREFAAIDRLDSLIRLPLLLAYEQLCELAGRRLPAPERAAEETQVAEETQAVAEEPAVPIWPIIGLGTNLLYDVTYIPGYGFTSIPSGTIEYYPESGHVTIGADVEWPNWRHQAEHRFFQIHNVSLWGRYYFNPEQYRFNGWYVSGTANAAAFGVGWNKKGWEGEGIGISVGGGHKWTFGRIYIDAGLALGAFYSRFDSYTWGNDATGWYYYDYAGDPEAFEPRLKRWLWLGPTRLQITIGVDLFNRNRRKNK